MQLVSCWSIYSRSGVRCYSLPLDGMVEILHKLEVNGPIDPSEAKQRLTRKLVSYYENFLASTFNSIV